MTSNNGVNEEGGMAMEKGETYEARIEQVVNAPDLRTLDHAQLMEIFVRSRSLLFCGHFELISGNHTDTYFRFADIAQFPDLMAKISNEMVAWARMADLGRVDVVLSTNRAGMVLAYDVARALNAGFGTRAVYAATDPETGSPVHRLIDGFTIGRRDRVLVVNDLTTTANGLQTLIGLSEAQHASVVGVCVFASRAPDEALARIREKYSFHAVCKLRLRDWRLEDCHLCEHGGIPLVRGKDINSFESPTPIQEVLKPYYDNVAGTCH